jgi:hypothetical protein
MVHKFKILIDKAPAEVFHFLCIKDIHEQESSSPVLLLEKTTDGPVGVGTRYREVVQMAPFIESEIMSEITRYEQDSVLEETWVGGGMKGVLTYFFNPVGQGTELIQHVEIKTHWTMRLFDPVISKMYAKAVQYRLNCIKTVLETGRSPDIQKIKWWHLSRNR